MLASLMAFFEMTKYVSFHSYIYCKSFVFFNTTSDLDIQLNTMHKKCQVIHYKDQESPTRGWG